MQLQDIIKDTFGKLSTPLSGHGTYATLEKALQQAYDLGKNGETKVAVVSGFAQHTANLGVITEDKG